MKIGPRRSAVVPWENVELSKIGTSDAPGRCSIFYVASRGGGLHGSGHFSSFTVDIHTMFPRASVLIVEGRVVTGGFSFASSGFLNLRHKSVRPDLVHKPQDAHTEGPVWFMFYLLCLAPSPIDWSVDARNRPVLTFSSLR